ncbi:HD domain-containing protein [Pelotomaculum terephthalicicum JT]|uniref:HD domain-containing phosphohydrolase n=1 Tax=Pelotomaculum TaxID=191373 RepID=UPI0009C4A2C4|nr:MULTISPECIES: HD domain-containing phosphohydrolase [Pelotomaculum]MCG9968554.1 HD domain-containing protein [Pelotomaculum terephthalicicum JT]OPX87416.1 MAG: Cyclic di-GMP phosphodiesterase response regulator RpfG [Pelotomaculum sp. PtaB.Bin117]OPY61082.1 MAG: Cyclic di-GMP phosphodiesterase response regulator RpfG [Pelotomaculum sp. PtaU1.Bin065]
MKILMDPHRLLSSLSLCLDFTKEGIARHHLQVAYIGTALAEEIGLTEDEREMILLASLIHDAGVSTWGEKVKLAEFEIFEPWEHCSNGYEIISKVDFLKPVAEIIRHHHDRFGGGNRSGFAGKRIPLAARIIHLADRIDVLMSKEEHVLIKRDDIIRAIESKTGQVFDPELVVTFRSLARRESFWLDLVSPFALSKQIYPVQNQLKRVGLNDLKQIAEMFAVIIDNKSPFTYLHSKGVANVAVRLAEAMNFGREDLIMMEIAGFLHDLGKLSIPDEILEKPGSLSAEEFALIKQHTYYTFHILREAGIPSTIAEWAAYHHEKPNGGGYPFGLEAPQLSLGARIMAVADVFTALREDRPYRPGLGKKSIEEIMGKMVLSNALDGEIVGKLFDIYDYLPAGSRHSLLYPQWRASS